MSKDNPFLPGAKETYSEDEVRFMEIGIELVNTGAQRLGKKVTLNLLFNLAWAVVISSGPEEARQGYKSSFGFANRCKELVDASENPN